jgi:hypothetical protein
MNKAFSFLLVLILILSGFYAVSLKIWGNLPLPHLFHPDDYFMDYWNVVFQFKRGILYELGGFYHPLMLQLFSFYDYGDGTSSHQFRYENVEVTILVISIMFIASFINYHRIRERRFDASALFICFLSAPFIFAISRLNFIFLAYLIVSVGFYFYYRRPKVMFISAPVVLSILSCVKTYFFIYELLRWRSTIHVLAFTSLSISFAVLGTVMFNMLAAPNILNPINLFLNTFSFTTQRAFPVYEILSLNYSPFVFGVLFEAINTLFDAPVFYWALHFLTLGKIIITIFIGFFLFKMSSSLDEPTFFLLFISAILLLVPKIGGYVAVLLIPVLGEAKKILGARFFLYVAIMYCPVDFTLIMGNNNFVASPEIYASSEVIIHTVRKDISLLGLIRPLCLIYFWYNVFSWAHELPIVRKTWRLA